MTEVIRFWVSHRQELVTLLGEHVLLVAISTTIAVAIGVPLGFIAGFWPIIGAAGCVGGLSIRFFRC